MVYCCGLSRFQQDAGILIHCGHKLMSTETQYMYNKRKLRISSNLNTFDL